MIYDVFLVGAVVFQGTFLFLLAVAFPRRGWRWLGAADFGVMTLDYGFDVFCAGVGELDSVAI